MVDGVTVRCRSPPWLRPAGGTVGQLPFQSTHSMGIMGALEMAGGSLLPSRPRAGEIENAKTLSLLWGALKIIGF